MTRSRWLAGLLLMAAATGTLAVSQAPDSLRLQGTWDLVSVQRSGTLDPTPQGNIVQLVGNEVRFSTPLEDWTNATVVPVDPKKLELLAFS